MIGNISIFFSAVVMSLLLTFPLVWLLHFLKFGQPVRAEGPSSHQSKAGTPTMGGLGFVLAILIVSIVTVNFDLTPAYAGLLLLMILFAGIGLADDWLKIVRGKSLGLTFWQKIIAQIIAASIFCWFLIYCDKSTTLLGINNLWFYFSGSVFIIIGSANATNLTDGLNGLLAGTAIIAFASLAFLSNKLVVSEGTTFALIVTGALLSFLYFNFPKAKVFMGDLGSLSLGATLAGLALILHQEWRLAVIGGLFVIETLSVILQVTSYKLFKRRIFKMAPLHHHFELQGFKERQVVLAFWVIGTILGLIGTFL